MQALLFWNLTTRTLSTTPAGGAFAWQKLVAGEDITLKLRFVQTVESGVIAADRTLHSVKAAIGRLDARPTQGTFQLTVGSPAQAKTFTADAGTDVCTATAHGYSNGQQVHVSTSGALPGGLAVETDYFVRDVTTDTFKLAATAGGSAINLTSAGTGTHSITAVDTTADITFDDSTTDFAAALNALTDPALAAHQPFTVESVNGSWLVTAADKAEVRLVVSDNDLFPISFVRIMPFSRDEGTSYEIRLTQAAVAATSNFAEIVPPIPVVTEVQAGETNSGVLVNEIQKVFISPENPAGFSFILKKGFRKSDPIVLPTSPDAMLEAIAPLADEDAAEVFKVYAGENSVLIEFTGDGWAGADQDLLEVEVLSPAAADAVFTLDTKTDEMAILMRSAASATNGELKLPLEIVIELDDEQNSSIKRAQRYQAEVSFVRPLNEDAFSAAAGIPWATPLSRESYLAFSPTQVATGQRHYLVAALGDGTSDEITITHNLGTRFLHVDVQEAAADGAFLARGRVADGAEYEVEIVSDNAVKLIFAVAPSLNGLKAQITSAAHSANFQAHTHTIAEIDGLETRLSAAEEAIEVLQEQAGVQSIGSRDAEAGAKLLEVVLPVFVDAYPMQTSILAAAQEQAASAGLANASVTQIAAPTGTTTTTTGTPAAVAINSIRDIPAAALPADGDLLGAIHDATLEAMPGTVPTPGAANRGKVYQNRTAADIRINGGGGRASAMLRPGECAGSDGRRIYRLSHPDVDLARVFTAATSDACTLAQHGWSNTQRVRVFSTGTLPAGLSADTDYYIRDAATNTFKLAASSGGAAIDITDTGTGTHYIHTAPLTSSWYPADFDRELFFCHINSDQLLVRKLCEVQFGMELAILNKKTQAPRISAKITRAQWRLLVEIGVAFAEDAPATTGTNLKRINWQATPILDKTLFIANDTPATHVFGARIKRTAAALEAASFTVEKQLYGTWSASAATLAVADFFLRARLVQFDVEDIADAEGVVVLLGLDKTITEDPGDVGKLVVK